tara:strand:- start:590 stop:826 length:237 start_codon:yes stop_codon:yes gene_type:complete
MSRDILDNVNFLHPSTNTIGNWTEWEDEMILRYVHSLHESKNKNWSNLADQLKDRKSKQVRERWFNHINPIIKKSDWT